ncbi:MAG: phosphodiester glycosidase family protein [Rhodobacteraceae bacterium]|nr:phosphodiester glycosidase family protein [Paracoccaceae bacterium]
MRVLVALCAALLPQAVAASICRDLTFDGVSVTTCEVSATEDLRLFHSGPNGPLRSFAAVNEALAAEGKTLGFAMNAGMYHDDRAPVGLYREAGRDLSPLVTSDGPGNFGLLPNGVFCIGKRFAVVESRAYAAAPPACDDATQSGPMLVIKGKLHPRFLPGSDSLYIRNGVGVSADGSRAVFAITNQPVNFHHFARLFRDGLGLPDALYFDGKISRLYAPAVGRNDIGFALGPMVGTVVDKE